MDQKPGNPNDGRTQTGTAVQKKNRGNRLRAAFRRHPVVGIAVVCCAVLVGVAVWISVWNFGLPRTKRQAVMEIVAGLSERDRRKLALIRRDNLGQFHLGWGMGIRNGLGLWGRNKPLIRDISGGKPMHPDYMSGIIMQGVWDEVHKGERIPVFDESNPAAYFRQIDAFLHAAKEKNETKLLVHTPVWVLKDRSPYMARYLTHASQPLAEEARRIIAHKEPLTYLALQYLSEVERTGMIFQEIEAFLDDPSVVPLPQPIDSSGKDGTVTTSYTWTPKTVSQIAAMALGDLYLKYFESAGAYRAWKAVVDADPILRWKYQPVITDGDLRGLLADRIEFARILCLSRRWIEFEGGGHYELKITEDGATLLERLTREKVSQEYDEREALAIRLLQRVLEGVPIPELIEAIRINPTAEAPDWNSDRNDKYAQDYFGAAVIQAKQEAIAEYSDKKVVWDLLEQHRREAKVCWLYKEYLCASCSGSTSSALIRWPENSSFRLRYPETRMTFLSERRCSRQCSRIVSWSTGS